MLKKYYLLFLLLIYPLSAFPSFFDELAQCFDNPCNCGFGTVDEYWNEKVVRTIKPEPLCPPYNRRDGRDFDNCLNQFDPPTSSFNLKSFITSDLKSLPSLANLDLASFTTSRLESLRDFMGYYSQHCAEQTAESTYFAPKIRIRHQACNSFACWSQSATLKWDGDCIFWPGPYPPLTLLRICARIALPAVPPDPKGLNKEGTPQDPGYTKGKHLNQFGATEADKPLEASDGTLFVPDPPKLCAYKDPGLITLDLGDPMDVFPTSQPFHKTAEIHPIVKVILFLVKTLQGVSPANLLDQLLEMLGAEKIPGLDILQVFVKGIAAVANAIGNTFIELLKTYGSLNKDVDDYQFGCVELPIGPFPPPYCPKLDFTFPSPSINTICSTKDSTGIFIQNSKNPCVVSSKRNNFVNNAVRISMDNLIRVCKPNEEPNKCVQIKGASPTPTATEIHTETVYLDTIRNCAKTGDKRPCFTTNIQCGDQARIVYVQKIGVSTKANNYGKPNNYFLNDLPDCGSLTASKHGTCQAIWGINSGEFADVSVKFPEIQKQDPMELAKTETMTASLKDTNNLTRNFVVSIVKTPIEDSTIKPSLTRDPQTICVAEGTELVGCIKRVLDQHIINTYPCSTFDRMCSSNNNYFTPEFIAAIEVRDFDNKIIDSTKSVVAPLTANTSSMASPNTAEQRINLAGLSFSFFMADIADDYSVYTAMPFSGPQAMNPSTIYGEYKDGKVPYEIENSSGKMIFTKPDPIYLKGLEYVNGKYIQGGTHGCLQPKELDKKCMPGVTIPGGTDYQTNCVLAKIMERETIDCQKFKEKTENPANPSYQFLGICPNYLGKTNKNCTAVETIPGTNEGITIYSCKGSPSIYCYENNQKAGVEICKTALDKDNRIIPAPSKGAVINKKDEHFQVVIDNNKDNILTYGKPTNYDPSTQAVRDKTPIELGFCVPYPVPTCDAIPASNQSGNAAWPETKIGEEAIAVCKPGFASPTPLKRYCLANAKNKTIKFEDLPSGAGCINDPQGLIFKYSSTGFKPQFPNHYTGVDKATKIATFLLGDDYGKPEASLYNTLNCANYEFEIPNTQELEYFTIGDNLATSFYNNYLMIKINDKIIYTGPHNFSKMSSSGAAGSAEFKIFIDGLPQSDKGTKTVLREMNIMDKLIPGKNNINICVGVVERGILKLMMKYKLK